MLRKIFASVLLAGLACRIVSAADAFALLTQERIGELRIGLSEGKVRKHLSGTLKRGPEKRWAADGAYHQEWRYAGSGITLGMVSPRKGDPKVIESITLAGPATLSTQRGIRIGSTRQQVVKAYKRYWNREDSKHAGGFVAGSIYGGLIIHFQNGKVSEIYLGAAAE
jgi:hypothetical protein